ncbi:EAL domain-containing protein [Shewanella surugensis]|uniref:EAL domain-containing protein n=1 Tax=Shewanella surugensis TaxID=212020 RepID=A0ABT0L667_9GAMM|nr:EAL domain-containing protein [Shewanella surugensis]MCL1123178.1 EAL domain-containing protein [Shewanella surugensis]
MDTTSNNTAPRALKQQQIIKNFRIKMAFQPIIDIVSHAVIAHEALVRGEFGESAETVLSHVAPSHQYQFDQQCRFRAIQTAVALHLEKRLFVNFCPNVVKSPSLHMQSLNQLTNHFNFPKTQLVLELTEAEEIIDLNKVIELRKVYRKNGLKVAIDDFGSGYAGLGWLVKIHPDIVKLDMSLIQNIDLDKYKRAIVQGIIVTCQQLDIMLLAEGIETMTEYLTLKKLGIRYMQGYFFSKPTLGSLTEIIAPLSCLQNPKRRSA